MKLRLAAVAFGGIAMSAVVAGAQITDVKAHFVSGSVSPSPGVIENGQYYVGPYTGQIQIGNGPVITLPFNCVDFFHDVVNNQNWTASLSNIGTGYGIGTATRLQGSQIIDGHNLSADNLYEAAAYLVSTYPPNTNPVTNPAGTIATQNEIWDVTSLFNPNQTRGDGLTFTGQYSTLSNVPSPPAPSARQAAESATADGIGALDTDFNALSNPDSWWVLTINPTDQLGNPEGPQEFIIQGVFATPEPGTLTLLASGLFAVVGAGYGRRRKQRATEA